ncbi:low molecular weight protein-tyrosine-phosphatase [Altericroceibacterium spongiae]
MAEGALRAAADKAGIDVFVDSVGTGSWHIGEPPDPRAQDEMKRHGVSIAGLKGRQINAEDYRRFTHIFALDDDNLEVIRQRAPSDASAEIMLLLDMVEERQGQPVADPYFGGADGFARTWEDVSAAADALVAKFRR